jgi:uncharacterized iron-regulated membrane protein
MESRMLPLFAGLESSPNPLIIVLVSVGLLFIAFIALAAKKQSRPVVEGAVEQKKPRRRWWMMLFGIVCFVAFGVGLALMHLPAIVSMILGNQKPFDQTRAKRIIEELRQQEPDKAKLLMLKELEVIIEDQPKD